MSHKGKVVKKKVTPLGKHVRFMWEKGDVVISKTKKVVKSFVIRLLTGL